MNRALAVRSVIWEALAYDPFLRHLAPNSLLPTAAAIFWNAAPAQQDGSAIIITPLNAGLDERSFSSRYQVAEWYRITAYAYGDEATEAALAMTARIDEVLDDYAGTSDTPLSYCRRENHGPGVRTSDAEIQEVADSATYQIRSTP